MCLSITGFLFLLKCQVSTETGCFAYAREHRPELGRAIQMPLDQEIPSGIKRLYQEEATGASISVNPDNRLESLNFYKTHFQASPGADMDWTGDNSACLAGTTAQGFKDAVLLRINYYRAMAGVPAEVGFLSDYSGKAQQAAQMMSVNGSLDHSPPSSWTCYTAEGAEAAGKSNLALGSNGWNAISLYMKDPGDGNQACGHRRWILYPQTTTMGTGDIPSGQSNALWVFDGNYGGTRPETRDEFVSWPPPGYVPYQVVYPRWSFAYPGADFSGAAVTMTQGGENIPVELAPVHNGYGENTLVWIPNGMSSWSSWPKPDVDTTYEVTVSNVTVSGAPRNFSYQVTVFDVDSVYSSFPGSAIFNLLQDD